MDRDQQQQPSQQSQRENIDTTSQPTTENTGQQFFPLQYSQVGHMAFAFNQAEATPGSHAMHEYDQSLTQPPPLPQPFASAAQAALDDVDQATNMYAIQTYVQPVPRENNDQSPFLQSLGKHSADGNTEAATQTTATPMHEPRAQRTGLSSTDLAANKATNRNASRVKSPPVKATAGKIKSAVGGAKNRRKAKTASDQLAPYDYLKNMLAERGYSFATIKSTEVGYMTDPSPLQLASFGTKLVNAVHTSDVTLLTSFLKCGLSPNPCNQFRDSVLDWACKKANDAVFRCFLDHNVDIRVCDGFGRTPLHHSAWADTFSPNIAHGILQRDPIQLFLEDSAGRTPLEYVPPKLSSQWIAFLENRKEELFPVNGPPLAVTKRQYLQLPDPANAISVDLARLISAGHVQPEQVAAMDEFTRKTWKMPK
jgi:hypothetical protein